MSQVVPIKTDAIASSAASKKSNILNGLVARIRLDLLESDGTASSNTADFTLTDELGEAILTVTGVTGIQNFYRPQALIDDETGTATTSRMPYLMISNRLTLAIANGTNGEIARAYIEMVG